MNFFWMNFSLGICLFIIDRTMSYFKEERTETEEKELELDFKRNAEQLEEMLSYIIYKPGLANDIISSVNIIKNNVFLKQFVVFVFFQIPAINIFMFLSNFKKDKNKPL